MSSRRPQVAAPPSAPLPSAPLPSAWPAALLAALLVVTGTLHFVATDAFASIVPGFLGAPDAWVRASGVAELACALGLALRRTRRAAGWATAALFVVVFPANVQMVVDALQGQGSVVVALGRLPLQVPLIAWALWVARRARPAPPAAGAPGAGGARPARRPA